MVIWSGYALAVTWGWFVVATLHVPPLTVPAAIGIALVVRFMTWQDTTNDEPPAERLVGQIFMGLIKPALILGFGWVVHQFM